MHLYRDDTTSNYSLERKRRKIYDLTINWNYKLFVVKHFHFQKSKINSRENEENKIKKVKNNKKSNLYRKYQISMQINGTLASNIRNEIQYIFVDNKRE